MWSALTGYERDGTDFERRTDNDEEVTDGLVISDLLVELLRQALSEEDDVRFYDGRHALFRG